MLKLKYRVTDKGCDFRDDPKLLKAIDLQRAHFDKCIP